MGNSGQKSMQNEIFNMKFTSKQLVRRYEKYEKQSNKRKKEVAKAVKDGNLEIAKEYAQMAIRDHKTGISFLGLSSKIDAVVSRLEAAERQRQITPMMSKAVHGMKSAMDSLNVDKLTETMGQFETIFEDLDVKAGYMDATMNGVSAASTPVDEVDKLMEQVAAENGLEVAAQLDAAGLVGSHTAKDIVAEPSKAKEDEINARLKELRAELG
eukprot:g233.t1